MKKEQLQQEFQQIKDQVLTFAFSEQLSPTLPYKNTKSHNNSEKHRLELTNKNHLSVQKPLNLKQINSNIKKIESSMGKIITLGSATFKSNFECGNLSNVKLLSSNTFQVELQTQTNSNRISNWFDFTVEGIKGQANFIIKGFTKSSSLYNEGMKVCCRDISEQSKWRRGGTKITYTNSQDEEEQKCTTYELRFSYFFKSNSCIEFAYCFPYGLKKLYHLIHQIKSKVNYKIMGKTFNGLDIPLITIGNQSKQVIVLSARVHPGETVSSFIIQGFIRELISDSQYAQNLRSKYLFKIVPMLNPDGVIKGNYRFSGYGCDLNRKWSSCKPKSQPEIYFLKDLIKEWNKQKKVIMYIDIHGHSRKKNVFFYGCSNKQSANLKSKQFPYLMQKVYDAFKYSSCSFNISKDKQGTARVTLWKELQIDYVYTLQASFCGSQHGPNYNETDYEKIGKKLCQGMSLFFYQRNSSAANTMMQRMLQMKQKAFAQLQQNDLLYNFEDENGSESQPQKGQIQQNDRNSQTGLPKKESLIKNIQRNQPQIKVVSAINFFPRSFRAEKNKSIVSQRTIIPKPTQTSQMKNHLQIQMSPLYTQKQIIPFNFKKYSQIQEQNPLFTKNYESFKNTGLFPRKIRVYSLNRNAQRQSQKTQPFLEQAQQTKNSLKVSLMQGREGVQYRRVRKLVQQNYNRQMTATEQQSSYVVKQLQGNQLKIGKLQKTGRKYSVTPRFYPVTQQKNRRTSADIYLRKHHNEYPSRMSINPAEASINCKGIEIPKYSQKMRK